MDDKKIITSKLRMKCKDLKVKELETMVEKTKFKMEVSTTETRDEKKVWIMLLILERATNTDFRIFVGS